MEDAVDSALEAARQSLQQQQQQGGSADVQPTLAMVFVSSAFAEEYERIVDLIKQRVPSIKHVSGNRRKCLIAPGLEDCCAMLRQDEGARLCVVGIFALEVVLVLGTRHTGHGGPAGEGGDSEVVVGSSKGAAREHPTMKGQKTGRGAVDTGCLREERLALRGAAAARGASPAAAAALRENQRSAQSTQSMALLS